MVDLVRLSGWPLPAKFENISISKPSELPGLVFDFQDVVQRYPTDEEREWAGCSGPK